jgi:NADH:ubiquinone oxidoreductase subunit
LLPFFAKENNSVFYNGIGNLLKKIGLSEYNPSEWRLFIDSSKRSLKCVILNNGNKYNSIPTGHSTTMKEE